jgi:hypothetical protein
VQFFRTISFNRDAKYDNTSLTWLLFIEVQMTLSNQPHQGTREICRVVQDVGILRFYYFLTWHRHLNKKRKSLTSFMCNLTAEFSDILWLSTKIYASKVFLLTKIKPEYSDILYNTTYFPGPLVWLIRQGHLYFNKK